MTSDHQETRRPLARRVAMARFVVSVDHQPKSSFDDRQAAEAEAATIQKAFPKLTIQVTDTQTVDDTPAST